MFQNATHLQVKSSSYQAIIKSARFPKQAIPTLVEFTAPVTALLD